MTRIATADTVSGYPMGMDTLLATAPEKDDTPKPEKNPAAVALGRLGGLAGKGISTPARRRAAKRNGKLGGRPKKTQAAE